MSATEPVLPPTDTMMQMLTVVPTIMLSCIAMAVAAGILLEVRRRRHRHDEPRPVPSIQVSDPVARIDVGRE